MEVAEESQRSRVQRFVRALTPARWWQAIEAESRQWWMLCPCGARTTIFEMGGLRFKAKGHPKRVGRCSTCGEAFVAPIQRDGG